MKKSIIGLVLVLTSMTSSAYVIDTEACAGTEYIYDLSSELVEYDAAVHTFVDETTPVFYAAYEKVPHIWLNTVRITQILITNTSNTPVSFFYRPTYYSDVTGNEIVISPEVFGGAFNSSNTPLAGAGATMPANTHGRITLNYTPSLTYGSAQIYWDSSTCLAEGPINASVETSFYSGSRGGSSVYLINNGNTW